MLYPDRVTVCVSSQAGLRDGLRLLRHRAGRLHAATSPSARSSSRSCAPRARREAMDRRLGNVVFMGMGEPLANEAAVWGAVERLHGDLGLSARHITISHDRHRARASAALAEPAAAGQPRRVAARRQRRAARRDGADQQALPARRPDATRAPTTSQVKGRRISFEWAMIDGVNDRDSDADELAALCRRFDLAGARQPDPAQPDARLADEGSSAAAGRASSATCSSARASTRRSAATAAPTSTPPAVSSPPVSRSLSPARAARPRVSSGRAPSGTG